MEINAIWTVAEPYVMAIVGALGGGTVIYALARALLGKWLKSFAAKYDTDDMTNKLAQKLASKTLNIDMTAFAEKKLDKIETKLHKQVREIREETAAQRHILAQIGKAVAHFKSLTDEERNALQEAVKALDANYTPPAPEEILTVKLEPIPVAAPAPEEEADAQESAALINFGGIGQ